MSKATWTIDKMKCPNCGELITISETLAGQIAERAQQELKAESLAKQKELTERERTIATKESDLELVIEKRVKAASEGLERLAVERAQQALGIQLEDLRREAAEKRKGLEEARKVELSLRARQRELEEKEKSREVEVARTLDAERRKIQDAAYKAVEEQHRLKDAEREKKLLDAIRVNAELKRKLEQGSQQTQGEVLELDLEGSIRQSFPVDQVTPVPKGVSGADILQAVCNARGAVCGTLIWETKRTKNWSDTWLAKLKEDQRIAKADLAILVSEALPKNSEHFQEIKGVWVTHPRCAINLEGALRLVMVQVAQAKSAAVGKNEKMEVLYGYLSGPEFRHKIEAIVEAFNDMETDLREERRVTERRWAKREKQIQKVISNTSGMYGDLQGLIGSSLHNIPALTDQVQDD
jgi:hypothetical protein